MEAAIQQDWVYRVWPLLSLLMPEVLFLGGLAAFLCGLLSNTRPLKSLVVGLFTFAAILLGFCYLTGVGPLKLPPGEAGIALGLLVWLLFFISILFIPLLALVAHLVLSSALAKSVHVLTYTQKAVAWSFSFLFILAAAIYLMIRQFG
jgi:hypothetical protein